MRRAALALALGLLLASRGALAADAPVELKLSHWLPPTHPFHAALQGWAADLEKDSGGTIKTVIFPAQQLGQAVDHYDMARDGIADLAFVVPGYQPGRFAVVAAAELPLLLANATGGSAGFDAWYRPHAAREMRDVHYCLGFVHDPGVFHARSRKIMVPADLAGLKVRPPNATVGRLVTLLGGTNVQASAPEARDILERGVADAITFPWNSTILFGIDKATKYHMDAPFYVGVFAWVMSKARYDGMSPSQRKAIDDHCTTEWAEKLATPWAQWEEAGREKLKAEPGQDVYGITPEQLALWRQAAAPLTEAWEKEAREAGESDPAALLAGLKASLAEHHAAY